MSTDPTSRIFTSLLDGTGTIHPELQERIYQHLSDRKDLIGIGKLAQRSELTEELDMHIGRRTEAVIVAGWLSRAGRSAEQIEKRLNKEKRSSVLSVIAGTSGLPEDIYRRVPIPTLKVAENLIGNTSVPRDVRIEAIKVLARQGAHTSAWRNEQTFGKIIAEDREFATIVATLTPSPTVARMCLDRLTPVEPELVASLIERLDVLVGYNEGEHGSGGSDLCEALAVEHLDDRQIANVRRIAKASAKRSTNSYHKHGYENVLPLLEPKGRKIVDSIRRLAESQDPNESVKLMTTCLASRTLLSALTSRALWAVVRNTVLPPENVLALVDDMSVEQESALARRWVERGELRKLAELASNPYYQPHWVDEIGDSIPLLAEIFALAADRGDQPPAWALSSRHFADCPEKAVDLIPWSILALLEPSDNSNGTNQTHQELILQAVQRMLVDKLGDDTVLWETFTALSGEFTGTLPELIETVKLVSR